MKKSCLLLIALCLLLGGCGTGANYKRIDLTVGETTPPETTDLEAAVGKNTKVKCSAVDLLPDTMPVYRIIPHTVTREEAQQFADYFGITEELNSEMNQEGNGNVWVRDNTLKLSIPQKQDMEMTLSDAQVIEMGEKLLAELTFLPGEYVCEGVTSRRTVTKGDVSYVCYKGLTFYRVLDGVQVRYDDACHIGFTENGVVDLYFTFFDYEKTDEYLPLLSLKDVLPQVLDPEDPDAFGTDELMAKPADCMYVEKVEMVYYNQYSRGCTILQPVYCLTGTAAGGECQTKFRLRVIGLAEKYTSR